ncbi:MAG: hypothetical protein K0R02_1045 [Rickettsiaceae bacterium]|jgi:hypothetical protein|nr:hypothetical protein [Rickettsiaceae bacterium]
MEIISLLKSNIAESATLEQPFNKNPSKIPVTEINFRDVTEYSKRIEATKYTKFKEPILEAIKDGNIPAVIYFTENTKVNLNFYISGGAAGETYGYAPTFLQLAAFHNHPNIIEYALYKGATNGLEDALNIAISKGYNSVASLLQSLGTKQDTLPKVKLKDNFVVAKSKLDKQEKNEASKNALKVSDKKNDNFEKAPDEQKPSKIFDSFNFTSDQEKEFEHLFYRFRKIAEALTANNPSTSYTSDYARNSNEYDHERIDGLDLVGTCPHDMIGGEW